MRPQRGQCGKSSLCRRNPIPIHPQTQTQRARYGKVGGAHGLRIEHPVYALADRGDPLREVWLLGLLVWDELA